MFEYLSEVEARGACDQNAALLGRLNRILAAVVDQGTAIQTPPEPDCTNCATGPFGPLAPPGHRRHRPVTVGPRQPMTFDQAGHFIKPLGVTRHQQSRAGTSLQASNIAASSLAWVLADDPGPLPKLLRAFSEASFESGSGRTSNYPSPGHRLRPSAQRPLHGRWFELAPGLFPTWDGQAANR